MISSSFHGESMSSVSWCFVMQQPMALNASHVPLAGSRTLGYEPTAPIICMVIVPPLLGSSRSPAANCAAPRLAVDEPPLPAPPLLAPPAGLVPPLFAAPPFAAPDIPLLDVPPLELFAPATPVPAAPLVVALAPVPAFADPEPEGVSLFEEQPKLAPIRPAARLKDRRARRVRVIGHSVSGFAKSACTIAPFRAGVRRRVVQWSTRLLSASHRSEALA